MPLRRTHLSLFSGIGGPDLAAEWMGWENISHTEWNPFGQRVLQYYWPNAASHHDITKTDYTIYRGRVDILTGGFPCQGFSLAGKRMGTDDDRYLWPEMRRAYQECRPHVIIGENVTGLLSMEDKSGVYRDVFPQVEGRTLIRTLEADHYEAVYTRQAKMLIGSICEDLEEDGYEVIPFVIPAAAVGAPHKRERVFIIAFDTNITTDGGSITGTGKRTGLGLERDILRSPRWEQGANDAEPSGFDSVTNTSKERRGRRPSKSGRKIEEAPERSGVFCKAIRYGFQRATSNTSGSRSGQIHNQIHPEKPNGVIAYCNGYEWNAANHTGIGLERWSVTGSISGDRKVGKEFPPGNVCSTWHDFPTQSPVCNGNDGFSAGLDLETIFEGFTKPLTFSKWRSESIKAGGNAIAPQVIYQLFEIIEKILTEYDT